ncbi:hypothetical protein tinsulaeT_17290 [Thalassotalea insulae]|uniref:DUF4340 domain-containing protein n=1 Tax=Thalassotalea insulae TaxID=2056778 RepID=A0ABQ6GRY6_9GAMM|nr:hypothetical protein [Thalassotalea insulae]GLX78389.1 hypothetical protein tinsulaeT_17290 [Thalassotalea insulae]
MIKFSRAGWNNIIIFAVMGFILLINATHDNVFTSRTSLPENHYILGENSVILTLTLNQQIKVERIGNSWRATPPALSGQALEQMMLSWQRLEGDKIAPPDNIDPQLGLIISIEVAGQAQANVLTLHIAEQQLLIYHHQDKLWYALALPIYQQLLPEQLFNS